MDQDQIVQQVMNELRAQNTAKEVKEITPKMVGSVDLNKCGMTEFVGTAMGDTIGLVIANLDESLHERLGIDKKYRSLGIIGARTGAGPQAISADEAVKASNTEVIIFETSNDTKGGGGHGCLIVFGAEEVSDARRAVEITLSSLDWAFGGVVGNENGFLEVQYTARASDVLTKYFGAELGKAWGLINGCPAAVGMLMADAAVKAADVKIVKHCSPGHDTSFTSEFTIFVTGDSGAVKQAVLAGKETAIKLLRTMGPEPVPMAKPYF